MKSPVLENIRNIGIISHIDAGKTTVSERMLYYTGEIHRMGEVHDGSATMDWMDQEQERGITITATSTAFRWQDLWINLIDTPGHIDFTIEVERSLRVLDGAVAIFSAVEGVQPQSESVWHQADRYHVPRICFINKMDRIGADFDAVLQSIEERLKARPIPLQLPVGAESEFNAIIDVLGEQLLTFSDDDLGSSVLPRPLPEDLREQRNQALEKIVEAAADYDDSILQDFLEGKPISREQLIPALRKGVHACEIFPVLVGSALRNKGVQPLLDAVGDFLPSPLDLPPVQAHRLVEDDPQELSIPCDPKGPLVALAFKVVSDEGRKLTYLRIYSGRLEPGMDLHNPRLEKPEKIARLFRMHAHKRERLHEALAGDIVAAAGLKDALTGDTLSAVDFPVTLAGLTVPEPVVSLAVEPKGVDDREKLLPSLEKLQWEDPTFRVREDAETGQTILTGMGELHLEVVINRLEREFHVQTTTGKPQVVYRETLNKQISRQEIFEREVDGRLQRGEVHLELTPLERGSGIHILLPDPETCALPEVLQMLLRQSLEQACAAGVKTGYPLTDLQVRVVDAPYDPATTTEMGLRAAAQRGLAMAARDAAPTLLEPIMSLELIVPSESSGKVLGSLQQKRGRVEGMLSRGELEVIKAQVALSEMFGYMTELRSATRGRGTFTMEFSHFDQAPQETLQRFGF